jgi:hypothetical protein
MVIVAVAVAAVAAVVRDPPASGRARWRTAST